MIDGIAFQTNILARKAAVEVARAGELGIGRVNDSVAAIDQMTQSNAVLVEHSAAAADTLKQQAGTLSALVATFRLQAA